MQTDKYTKAVLTVIAAALVCLVFRDAPIIPQAHAAVLAGDPVNVKIVSIEAPLLMPWEPLPVKNK